MFKIMNTSLFSSWVRISHRTLHCLSCEDRKKPSNRLIPHMQSSIYKEQCEIWGKISTAVFWVVNTCYGKLFLTIRGRIYPKGGRYTFLHTVVKHICGVTTRWPRISLQERRILVSLTVLLICGHRPNIISQDISIVKWVQRRSVRLLLRHLYPAHLPTYEPPSLIQNDTVRNCYELLTFHVNSLLNIALFVRSRGNWQCQLFENCKSIT